MKVALGCEVVIREDTHPAQIRNLSTQGAAVACALACEKSEIVQVCIFLTLDGIEDADRTAFETTAAVQWSKQGDGGAYLMGVRFISPPQHQMERLQRFLRKRKAAQ